MHVFSSIAHSAIFNKSLIPSVLHGFMYYSFLLTRGFMANLHGNIAIVKVTITKHS